MNKKIYISYKDFAEWWDRTNAEADLNECVRPLPENATEKDRNNRHLAWLAAKATGMMMPGLMLRLAGLMPEVEDLSANEDFFELNDLTTPIVFMSLEKMAVGTISPMYRAKADPKAVELFLRIPEPVWAFWCNKWVDHVTKSMQEVISDEP